MSSYDFLAGCYDRLTYDVDYAAWADYIESHFRKKGIPGKTVLDLACGTGSLTYELAQRGYEMIGVDLSPEMLSEAMEKDMGGDHIPPMFLCQSMDKLDLYGTIDACVCCLDSANYVTDKRKLQKAFQRPHRLSGCFRITADLQFCAAVDDGHTKSLLDALDILVE